MKPCCYRDGGIFINVLFDRLNHVLGLPLLDMHFNQCYFQYFVAQLTV